MTATARQLAALVQHDQVGAATALEDQAVAEAQGDASTELAAVVTAAAAGWVVAFGALTVAGAGPALSRYLAGVRRGMARATAGLDERAPSAVEARLGPAVVLGARHAVAFAERAAGGSRRTPSATVPADALSAARGLRALIREQLHLSTRLLSEQQVRRSRWPGVLTGIGAARQAVATVGRVTAWSVHRAVNDGAAQAITELAAAGLWVAEPNACVRCLAYSGRRTGPDRTFPGGLSMDPHQHDSGAAPISGPPLHPHCRCRLVPWRDEWAPRRGPALPDLLRDQAWRSIAAGAGRPTESRAARLRAAHALLAARGVPTPVRHQARAAVAAGHF